MTAEIGTPAGVRADAREQGMARQTGRSSFEQLWLRLWIMFAIAGLFVLASRTRASGRCLGDAAHIALLALFGAERSPRSSTRSAFPGRRATTPSGASSASRACRTGRRRPTRTRCRHPGQIRRRWRSGALIASAWRRSSSGSRPASRSRAPIASIRSRFAPFSSFSSCC